MLDHLPSKCFHPQQFISSKKDVGIERGCHLISHIMLQIFQIFHFKKATKPVCIFCLQKEQSTTSKYLKALVGFHISFFFYTLSDSVHGNRKTQL